MHSNQSDRYFGFADLMSIGTLSVAVLLVTTQAANPMIIFITIAIVCGIGLVAGALLAELYRRLSDGGDKRLSNCREHQR